MRNVWKGLIVGGMTGVAAGMVLDGLSKAGEEATRAGQKAREQAPQWAERARQAAELAAEKIREVDIADKAKEFAEKAVGAELTAKAKEKVESVRKH